jgi:hypothetical protein
MDKYIYINIRKPIYGTYVGIREKYLWKAKREKKLLKIEIPQGVCIISPDKFLKGSRRIEKVFKIPTKPMVLYCRELTLTKQNPIEDVTIPFDIKERLREVFIEKYL